MENKLQYKAASFLYKYFFPLYRTLYNRFKMKQDAHEVTFLKENIKEGDVVLDIGSNIGFYAKIMSDLAGDTGKVHCFEPDKINFRHLRDLLHERSNVVLNNKAVGDKTGQIEIFTSHRLNVDHRTYRPEKFASSYFIDVVTIDDYLDHVPRINFIKMDIQGAELFALKGMRKTISENKNLKILTEFWPHGLKSAGSSASEVLTFMTSLGYSASLMNERKSVELTLGNLNSLGETENDFYNVLFSH